MNLFFDELNRYNGILYLLIIFFRYRETEEICGEDLSFAFKETYKKSMDISKYIYLDIVH